MSSSSRDSLYLEHIAERIRRIEDAAENGRDAFESSCILQDAIIRNFEVIGEAVKQLSPERRDQYRRSRGVGLPDFETYSFTTTWE